MQVADVLYKLKHSGKKNGKWYLASCPCHNDKIESLSLCDTTYTDRRGNNRNGVSIKCFAGCTSKAIRDYLKTDKITFFKHEKSEIEELRTREKRKIVAIYPYYDQHELLYEVVRFEPKHFSQRRKNPVDNRYVWGITEGYYYLKYNSWIKCDDSLSLTVYEQVQFFPEVKPLLYNTKHVFAGLQKNNSARVFIVGGEKDVETLKANRFLALTNSGGEGAGRWRQEFSEKLANLNVIFIPDNDAPGYEHLYRVAESLIPHCQSFKVVELPNLKHEHEDVSDWFQKHGGSIEYLKKLVETAEDYKHNLKGIKEDFIFKLDNATVRPTKSEFFAALEDEAEAISKFKDLSMLGLCSDCRGTGYSFDNVGGYTIFHSAKCEDFIAPAPCPACNHELLQTNIDSDDIDF